MTRRQKLLLAAALLVATDQGLQYTVLIDGVLAGVRVAPFDPPLYSPTQRHMVELLAAAQESGAAAALGVLIDPGLGWAPRPRSPDVFAPREPRGGEPAARRAAALGCSYTRGAEVAVEECWPALLSDGRADLEVTNLGVDGYGLDQALLRLERDVLPQAPDEVWLGWLPRAALRNTTRFPPLANRWTTLVLFKPRFRLESDGTLGLLPNPAPDVATTLALLTDQRAFLAALPHDPWIARAPAAFAPAGSSWTHRSALARAWLTVLARVSRDPARWLRDPRSEPRRLIAALVRRARRVSEERGARFRLVVLPSRDDLLSIGDGEPYWAGVTAELAETGVEVLDLTPALLAAGAAQGNSFWMAGGHYSPTAHALVARTIAETWLEGSDR